jgi:hypothetical protein
MLLLLALRFCIAAAEIGENTGLYVLGFNHIGIPIAYAMGYCLATFTTFVTILGRYRYASGDRIDSCCSVLEQDYNIQKLWLRFEKTEGTAKSAEPKRHIED